MKVFLFLAVVAVGFPSEAAAQAIPLGSGPGDGAERSSPPALEARQTVVRPDVDGYLEEEVWGGAPVHRGFIQREPVEGLPAMNDTEVRVLFDADALYIGAVLYDPAPERIARNLSRRDAPYSGQFDYFSVTLDPNLDGRTGYEFQVSAANVQADAYLFDDTARDAAWNAVWESAVMVDSRGWSVEIRIPFSQIRYTSGDGTQSWGVNFHRRRAQDNEHSSFALEPRLASGRVSLFGRLHGIRVPERPRRGELRPYVVSRVRSGPVMAEDPFSRDDQGGDWAAGLEVRYGLGSSFTLDGTVNPDFGQVEADPAVINLTAAETFFQEHRPFFVEDARVFDFDLTVRSQQFLFYTRRIGRRPQLGGPPGSDVSRIPGHTRILGAAKLTGRTQTGLSVGGLAALTRQEMGTAYFRDHDSFQTFIAEPRTAYGVIRLHQDLRGGSSRVGGIVTGVRRSLPSDGSLDILPSDAVTAGLDFEHSWADRGWILWGFAAGSLVRGDSVALLRIQQANTHYRQRPDLEWGDLDPAATSLGGGEWRLQLDRRGGRWQGDLWLGQIMPGFEVNDLGFRNQFERLSAGLALEFLDVTQSRWKRDHSLRFFTIHDWSHELLRNPGSWGRWRWAQTRNNFSLTGSVTLLNYWRVGSTVRYSPDAMSRERTRGGPRMMDPGSAGWSVDLSTDSRRSISVRPTVSLTQGSHGSGSRAGASLRTTVQPSTRVEVQVEPTLDLVDDGAQYVTSTVAVPHPPTFGGRYIFADIRRRDLSLQTRLNWIFTPKLSLEVFAQPLLSSAEYRTYKQLARTESYEFELFPEGTLAREGPEVSCLGGRTCRDPGGLRWIDLDGNGHPDISFKDRDFNLRSLRATAVVRWEYRPGSTLFLVWQRRQEETASVGDFHLSRDLRALVDAPANDVFMVKATLWFTL